jgi:hypothetical protein
MAKHAHTTILSTEPIQPVQDRTASRRLFLGAGAAGAVFAALKGSLAHASEPADDPASSLWERRYALRAPMLEALAARKEADARVSWWAADGPEVYYPDGSFGGRVVGWPADFNRGPPNKPAVATMIRPNPTFLKQVFMSPNLASPLKEMSERHYRRALRTLAELKRAQDAEKLRAGLPRAQARVDAIDDERESIEEQIKALPPNSPNATAARLVIAGIEAVTADSRIDEIEELEVPLIALEHLRPSLSGPIAEHVGELLDNRDCLLWSFEAYVGTALRHYSDDEALS